MKRTALALVLGIASLTRLLVACGGEKREPAVPQEPATESAPSAAAASPAGTPAPSPTEEPRKRKPFEVYSACSEVVTVVFAADPKVADAGKRTIAPSSAIEGPREADGNQTVWLLDAANEPLVKVSVTRGMKRVEIGRSCRTLDAR